MKKAKIFVLAVLTAAATMVPLSASAAVDPVSVSPAVEALDIVPPPAHIPHRTTPGACRHASMWIIASVTPRSEPRADAPAVDENRPPGPWPCRHFQAGGGYPATACGPGNTGWILIPVNPYPKQGWIINQCTRDPILS